MPFTLYHFGPSGFLGLAFRKWIDPPVFVLANVVVDVEVLIVRILALQWPVHRYAHTLLIGAVVGAIWGLAAYALRSLFTRIMQLLHVPYDTGFWKMVISGILGVWLHVLIDSIYHFDVRPFWPNKTISLWRMARGHISQGQIETICASFLIAAVVLYVLIVRARKRSVTSKEVNVST